MRGNKFFMNITISFRKIPGFDGYFISTDGLVVSTRRLKGFCRAFVRQYIHTTGCYGVDLMRNGQRVKCKVHRLVAQTYLMNPDNKPEVNHLNGDRFDNRLENLEWVTSSENRQHCARVLKKRGGNMPAKARLIDKNIPSILRDLKAGIKQRTIAVKYNVTPSVISRIKTGSRSCFRTYQPQERILK